MIIDTTNEQTQNDKIKNYLISRNINFKEVELYEKNLLKEHFFLKLVESV